MPDKAGWLKNPLLIWTGANFLGVITLALLLFLVPALFSLTGWLATLFILSLPVSAAQWLALRRFTPISILWILAMPLALLLSAWIFSSIPDTLWANIGLDDESLIVLGGLYLIPGLLIGLAQWLLLRRTLPGAWLWVLGSTVGIPLGFLLVLATGLIDQSETLAYLLVLLLYSIITGLVLSWLVGAGRQNAPNEAAA